MGFTPTAVHARQILDSRGTPTLEVDVEFDGSIRGRAAVPSGASTGSHEAVELRDGGQSWGGKAVTTAVSNVNNEIASAIVDRSFDSLAALDQALIELDGTENKGRLGANAILGVSLAAAHAAAYQAGIPLWKLIAELTGHDSPRLPVPMLNVINGGEHANNSLDVQEFMIVPHGFGTFSEALEAACDVFRTLKAQIAHAGMSTAVGDEGGFAPDFASTRHALDNIVSAIETAGYEPGTQIAIALDVAATEIYDGKVYDFKGERASYDADSLVDWYIELVDHYPIVSIEDGMSEDDWDGWRDMTNRLGDRIQIVGDDLFVTNPARLQEGIDHHAANSLLVKVNQIGTLTETLQAMRLATDHRFTCVMSHRSGETEDTTIADIATGTACGQIKTGAPSRSDRVAKYNQLLRIEEELGGDALYSSPFHTAAGTGA